MALVFWIVVAVVAVLAVVALGWRVASQYWSLPCPSLLAWTLEGSLVDWVSGTQATLDRMQLKPGQTVLEVGPGPGRLLIPAAWRVLPGGRAIGVDLQYKMVERLKKRAQAAGVMNLTALVGDATALKLDRETVDVVILCTVLGEIPERHRTAALAECFRVLKRGGLLAITEMLGDPHYQSQAKVERLARQAGFEPKLVAGGLWRFTASFGKP